MQIDFWYGHTMADIDAVSCSFYPNSGEYRGNVYKNGKAIGDFVESDSVEIENTFPRIFGE